MSQPDPALAAAAQAPLTLSDVEFVTLDLAACITVGATRGEVADAMRAALARLPVESRIPLMDYVLAARAARAAIAKATQLRRN